MQCPVDQTTLVMTDRQGVEIDYCPQCRGVWLDRGELDKVIDRSDNAPAPPSRPQPDTQYRDNYQEPRYDDRDRNHQKKKHREGFLGDLFDF